MAQIKPSSHGIVVDHKETGTRYAISDANYDSRVHTKVRDLNQDESILSFKPLDREPLGGDNSEEEAPADSSDSN